MKLSTRARYGVRMMLDLARRYGQRPVYLWEKVIQADRILVTFEEEQEAVVPGQAVVFCDRDIVLGRGRIEGRL